MTSDIMRWYVLNPKGLTITEVIVAGPYTTFAALEKDYGYNTGSTYKGDEYEAALMDSSKVDRHLLTENRMFVWLHDRSMHNPFQ